MNINSRNIYIVYILLYFSLLIGFYFNEDFALGYISDYYGGKQFVSLFEKDLVKTLLNFDLPPNAPVFTCIGYKELIAFINREYDLNEAIKRTTISTNRLVRHQNNWFKQEDN